MMTKEQYVQKHQSEIDALNAEIENLETEIKEAGVEIEAKANNEEHVNVLRRHRDEAKAKLADLQAAGDDGWEDFKYGLAHTWMAIKDNFARMLSRLTS